jgi:uracil-DNA glycosylase
MTFKELKDKFLNSLEGYSIREKVSEARKTGMVFPAPDKLFAAFDDDLLPIEKVKIVIVGQDPYPTPGQANGFAFSSDTLPVPYSLKVIFEEIRRQLYPYMGPDSFGASFASANLMPWTRQGILLMNRILTVESGKAESHKSFGWQVFTNSVIAALDADDNPKVFMLWGAKARDVKPLIVNPKHLVLEAGHPASEAYAPGKFTGNDHFIKADAFLYDHGLFEDIPMNLSGLITEEALFNHVQNLMITKRICVPIDSADMMKKKIRNLMNFNCVKVIDYRTVNV